ncbi:CGCGG family putative rSAM-modified RiPP protein [Niallia endozanthoxylica]|uniref:CGCGG family rSAM-modified RiPP protein n=1 Tax=Niallia endozanthoxylica TaxID=2036016 RepID=A0A5J5I0V3_9BACI|nr:CGCGG family rSAM-modified RiPP protein [Niallia endozanthoxylica]KAA9028573.1 CGCGG family rSAM-modified RiPP protein [Niallia endozanthoxylica]
MGKNWSVSFEHEEYEGNRDLIIEEAMEAVEKTSKGYYVNLVTPDVLGHPESYLIEVLEEHFKDAIKMKYIDQCGCGGYVLRVWKKE